MPFLHDNAGDSLHWPRGSLFTQPSFGTQKMPTLPPEDAKGQVSLFVDPHVLVKSYLVSVLVGIRLGLTACVPVRTIQALLQAGLGIFGGPC
jgi:hypothetical protein